MKRTLASLAIVAGLLTACGTANAAVPRPLPLDETTGNVTIQEDDPAWDCWTMGNRTCGANPIERTEAWGAFRTDTLPSTVLDGAFRVTYRGLALDDGLAGGSVQIPSAITPGKVHVFDVEVNN